LPPGDLPLYADYRQLRSSLQRLQAIEGKRVLLSSLLAEPVYGEEKVAARLAASAEWLDTIDRTVRTRAEETEDLSALTGAVVEELGLPPVAVNPLVASALCSHLTE
jgi:hypothetical protein